MIEAFVHDIQNLVHATARQGVRVVCTRYDCSRAFVPEVLLLPIHFWAAPVPDSVGIAIPESLEKKASISDMLSGNGNRARGTSGVEASGGVFSDGSVRLAAGVFSATAAGAAAVGLGALAPSLGGAFSGGDEDESTLPRIIGTPSLPPPMITTLEFVDCAS